MEKSVDPLTEIASSATRISTLARESDLTTPAVNLGRWKVRDVIGHLGGVHRWATRIVATKSMDGPGFTTSKLDGTELCDWFDSGVEDLLAAFRANAADEPCANFNPGSVKTVAWWSRRQMHETVVHRWDIERALGSTTPIKQTVAADGIDEFLDVFVRTRGKQTLIAPLLLTTTRPKQAWTLTPAAKPGRLDVTPGRLDEATTELAGRPDKMLLNLWGRLTISEAKLRVTGDADVAASLSSTP